jgi:hypothetical protein
MDRFVIIRDNMAGVFVGTLIAHSGKSWTLTHSRKIYYWTKAAAVEGIASFGPGPGSRVCPLRVPPVGGEDLVQIIDLTAEEAAALMALPVWTP